MQIRMTMRYYYIPIKRDKIKITIPSVGKEIETSEYSYIADGN